MMNEISYCNKKRNDTPLFIQRNIITIIGRYALAFFLLTLTCFAQEDPSHKALKYRLPSEVLKNIDIMLNTEFGEKAPYVNVSEDIKAYIDFELKRIHDAGVKFEGIESANLALLYARKKDHLKAIDRFESFFKNPGDQKIDDQELANLKSQYILECIEAGKLTKACDLLQAFGHVKLPFQDIIYVKLSEKYVEQGDVESAIQNAKKSVQDMEPELAFIFLEQNLSLVYQCHGLMQKLVDGIYDYLGSREGVSSTKNLSIENRIRQLRLIHEAMPESIFPDKKIHSNFRLYYLCPNDELGPMTFYGLLEALRRTQTQEALSIFLVLDEARDASEKSGSMTAFDEVFVDSKLKLRKACGDVEGHYFIVVDKDNVLVLSVPGPYIDSSMFLKMIKNLLAD